MQGLFSMSLTFKGDNGKARLHQSAQFRVRARINRVDRQPVYATVQQSSDNHVLRIDSCIYYTGRQAP